jgi:ABC-type transport system involved in cytochrome bd biosynthesis fused ATPase/permease subunit
VDGPLGWGLGSLVEISAALIVRLGAVILFSPVFLFIGIIVTVIGVSFGKLFMKAQLSTKREMSAARGPVLGHFAAAITGLSESNSISVVV